MEENIIISYSNNNEFLFKIMHKKYQYTQFYNTYL